MLVSCWNRLKNRAWRDPKWPQKGPIKVKSLYTPKNVNMDVKSYLYSTRSKNMHLDILICELSFHIGLITTSGGATNGPKNNNLFMTLRIWTEHLLCHLILELFFYPKHPYFATVTGVLAPGMAPVYTNLLASDICRYMPGKTREYGN